jgi:hypothetical protein
VNQDYYSQHSGAEDYFQTLSLKLCFGIAEQLTENYLRGDSQFDYLDYLLSDVPYRFQPAAELAAGLANLAEYALLDQSRPFLGSMFPAVLFLGQLQGQILLWQKPQLT